MFVIVKILIRVYLNVMLQIMKAPEIIGVLQNALKVG